MVVLQIVVFIAGVNCFVQGIILRQPLMILVAILGFGTTMTYLWYIFKAARGPADYIPEHLKAMVATGIAAYTAFLSVGLIGSPLEIEMIFETKFECVSITPFGSPVVPDV